MGSVFHLGFREDGTFQVGQGDCSQSDFLALRQLTAPPEWAILNRMVHYRTVTDINRVTAAIADPTRRAIIERLAAGPANISDLAGPFAMSLTGFCKHVRVLERAGLVRRTRHGRVSTMELAGEPLRDVAEWILKYEPFWNARLDRLEKFFARYREKLP